MGSHLLHDAQLRANDPAEAPLMPRTNRKSISKHFIGRCNCGLTFDTSRSSAQNYDERLDVTLRLVRRHLENPAFPLGPAGIKVEKHEVTGYETKVWLYE